MQKIDLDLHNKNDFDYEENKGTVFSIEDYKQMLKQEIKLLKKNDFIWNNHTQFSKIN